MRLDGSSLTPLYQQVLEDIKASIASGAYPPGSRIPSEAELSELYGVSRVTVRRAIEELSGEGYLVRRQGKGTYVNQRKLTRKIRQTSDVQSFSSLCQQMGMTPGAQVLERQIVPVQAEEQRFFGDTCTQLVYVSRLRTADGIPIMTENNYFPLPTFAFLLDEPLEDVSLFSLIRERTGLSPDRCCGSIIEIALADAHTAQQLAISPGDPLFFEHVPFLDQHDRPLCVSNKYLVGSRYQFEL